MEVPSTSGQTVQMSRASAWRDGAAAAQGGGAGKSTETQLWERCPLLGKMVPALEGTDRIR